MRVVSVMVKRGEGKMAGRFDLIGLSWLAVIVAA
jgi:hypothetical protein